VVVKYRQLGKTGIKVSEIGFGTWGLGGDKGGARSYGPVNDRESLSALNRAFELGINFYDTSDFYGFGHSETVLGRAFKGRRSKVVIAGKVGFMDTTGRQDFSQQHIRRSLEGSLKRLGTDYLDVYQLHSPPIELLVDSSDRNTKCVGSCRLPRPAVARTGRVSRTEFPETIGAMQKLQDEGLIRSWGVSLKSPDDGLLLLKYCHVGCVQVNFNLADQRASLNGLFDLCLKNEVGVIARTPLCFGFLTGLYADTGQLAESDHRRKWSKAQVASWHRASDMFVRFFKNKKLTKAQLALCFCLSFKAVSTVIPGMLTSVQVEENAEAGRMGALARKELAEIRLIYSSHDFFCGA